jgi:FkbM family methyltransferase
MMQNKIFKIEKCISSKNEILSMELNEDIFTMTRISNKKNAIQVDAVTIDSLVESLKLEKLDLIKFDIEGAERIAIEGAAQTLKNMKPKLALSGYHLVDDAYYLIDKILEIQPKYKVIISSNMHIYAF